MIQTAERGSLMKINIIPTPAEIFCSETYSKFSVTGVQMIGEATESILHGLSLLKADLKLRKDGNLCIYHGYEQFPEEIRRETQALFEEKYAKEQGYYLARDREKIVIAAFEDNGCVYALMTLLQMFDGERLPEKFVIKDKPDFRYRANKWLLWTEAGIWSYDRGDGIEKYKARIIRKLDLALKYKVNTIVFDGFGWKSERVPGYNDLMKALNREARKRKIHLMSSGYGMGYGMIGHGKGIYQGVAHLNRKSYPDGEIYPCIGTYDLGRDVNDVKGREYGTCISNEGLMQEKLKELTEYMMNTEPGALYIHNMDADYILEPLWLARCDECRKRWPSDCLWAEDGAAGAFAYFINSLYEGIASVKTKAYDAAKDCVVYIVSPGYIYMHAKDENFEKGRKFWQKISQLLPHRDKLYVGFREHYFNHDDNRLRYDMMRDGWGNCDFASIYFCGGDGFYSDKLFLGGGLFNCLMKSAGAIITENGNANQEAMQLYNAEYMWNCEHSAFYNIPDIPDNYEEFLPFYVNYLKTVTRPEEIYGQGGLLEVICEKLYGKEAAKDFVDLLRLHGKNMEPPLVSASSCEIYTNFSKMVFPMRWDDGNLPLDGSILSINTFLERFEEIYKVTKEAAGISADIYRKKQYFAELEEDEKWMAENFSLCEKFTYMLYRYMLCYKAVHQYFASVNTDLKKDDESNCLKKAIFLETDGRNVEEELVALQEEASALMEEINALQLVPIDPLGGAMIRREHLCDFISYNAEIMLRSIRENKRIPSGLRPLPKRESW